MGITFVGDSGDTGARGDASSILPISNGELLTQDTLRRPSDILRIRTEELARAVEASEFLLQSTANYSTILRFLDSGQTRPGLASVYSKQFSGDTYYFVAPKVPPKVATGAAPSLVIIGGATNAFTYVLNDTSFYSFYDQGNPADLVDSHNKVFGLKNVGDSICLRIPTVPSNYASETRIPHSTSEARPAGEAVVNSNLATALTDDVLSGLESKYSLIKVPSRNSIEVTISSGTLYEFFEAVLPVVGSPTLSADMYLKVSGVHSGGETDKYLLDLNGLSKSGDGVYTLPRSGYRDLEDLHELTITSYKFWINTEDTSETLSSGVLVPQTTLLPPNEYLLPLATYSGDGVILNGLGTVPVLDIESRGGEALIDTNGVILGETGAATKTFDTRVRFKFSDLINSVDQGGYAEHLVTGDTGYQYFRLPIDVNIPEAGADADIYLESLSLQLSLDEGYSDQISGIDQQVVRDVLLTIGLFDLSEDLSLYKSLGSVKMSLLTCNPGAQEFVDSALPKIALSNFRLKDMKDDNEALVELTNSIRNTPAAGSALIVWIFRDDSNKDDFFTTSDRGSINFELRAKWSTRLGDYTNLATSQTMSLLS